MSARFTAWLPRSLPLLLILGGCQPDVPGEAEATLVMEKADIRIANSLTTRALVFNALSTNPTANAMLGTTALKTLFNPTTGSTYIREQLLDEDAQHFMEYLTSCALSDNQSLSWKDPIKGVISSWPGKLGLCPSWYLSAPSEECLNRVSACIIARNNAFGRRVELSMRGELPSTPGTFSMEAKTLPTMYDPDTSQRVRSFDACQSAGQGVGRSCGWAVDYIGRCEPGEQVRLGAGGVPPDQCVDGHALGSSTGGRMMLRVCSGIAGCDNGEARFLAGSDGSCNGTAPAVSFSCPAEGYFNVMKAPWDSQQSGWVGVQVEEETRANAEYALSEARAFAFREGAFYGTIFDPNALGATVEVVNHGVKGKDQTVVGSVYQRMYSCYDAEWDEGLAMATHRVCASPEEGHDCAATVTGTCVAPKSEERVSSMCATSDGGEVVGDGDYEECQDSEEGTTWYEPVTVFLNAACDMMPPGSADLCARTPQTIP